MITPTMPQCAPTGRYTAMQTCALLDISKTTLLRWANLGYIRYRLTRTGRRQYRGTDIISCWRTMKR